MIGTTRAGLLKRCMPLQQMAGVVSAARLMMRGFLKILPLSIAHEYIPHLGSGRSRRSLVVQRPGKYQIDGGDYE